METTKPKTEDLTKLAIAPTHEVTLADIATYRGWIETETSEAVKALKNAAAKIADNDSMVSVVEKGKAVKRSLRIIEATFKEQVHRPRVEKWQESNDFQRDVIKPIQNTIKEAERAVTNFRLEQERRRREEEERRIAEQRRREAEQRRRDEEARAEQERQQKEYEEKKRAHEEALRKAEEERKRKEEDARVNQAAAAEAEGDAERAKTIIEQPSPEEPAPPTPPAPPNPEPVEPEPMAVEPLPEPATPEVPRVGGTKHKAPWKGRITNRKAFFSALLNDDPRTSWDAVTFKMSWFHDKARKDKSAFDVPGAEVFQEAGTEF